MCSAVLASDPSKLDPMARVVSAVRSTTTRSGWFGSTRWYTTSRLRVEIPMTAGVSKLSGYWETAETVSVREFAERRVLPYCDHLQRRFEVAITVAEKTTGTDGLTTQPSPFRRS